METEIPSEIASAIEADRRRRRRRESRFRVIANQVAYPVIRLSATGFTIEADEPPHLRGYVDILEGEERVARRLCVCVSAEDGLVGYEFKQGSAVAEVLPDAVAPGHAGLLEAPGD